MKKYSSITRVNSRRTSRNKRIGQTIAVLLIALALFYVTPKLLSKAASVVFYPLYTTQHWLQTSTESFPYFFRDRIELITEIRNLKAMTPEGGVFQVAIRALTSENEELRRLGSAAEPDRILAGVIGRPPALPYDVLVIDRGSETGVTVGAPVYSSATTVIGVVSQVYAKSAVVELLTSPGFTTTVYLYGPNVFAKAEGAGGGVLKVGVPQGILIEPGNVAVVPSVELGVFGEVTHVDSLPTDPEQFGYVTPNVALQSLRLVSVGRTPVTPLSFEEAEEVVAATVKDVLTIPVPIDKLYGGLSTTTASTTLPATTTTATSS